VADDASLRALATQLEAGGVAVAEASAETATQRGVAHLYQLQDPNGIPIELFSGPRSGSGTSASRLVPSGFCTGDEGLGHIVVLVRDAEIAQHFYCELLGMRVSDYIEQEIAPGRAIRITFLHANARHHTLAFTQGPPRKRIHHFMIEMNAINDVGLAYGPLRRRGRADRQHARPASERPDALVLCAHALGLRGRGRLGRSQGGRRHMAGPHLRSDEQTGVTARRRHRRSDHHLA
jgi:catechol 2,3-dioxygenase-like lactoylglutathione lyase family enzyme